MLSISNLESFKPLEFRAPSCFMAYAVDEFNTPNTTLVWEDKDDVSCSKCSKNIVRFTRSEILLVWIPPKAEADPETRILVLVIHSGPQWKWVREREGWRASKADIN